MSDQDKHLYNQHRVEMRRSYLTAHSTVLGVVQWDHGDDMFMDYIDITLACLFDRAHRINEPIAGKQVVPVEDLAKIEEKLDERAPKSAGQKMLDDIQAKQLEQSRMQALAGNVKADPWPQ
jgi:ABC-type lipopolysaccharide export system ATPase subunit